MNRRDWIEFYREARYGQLLGFSLVEAFRAQIRASQGIQATDAEVETVIGLARHWSQNEDNVEVL